jgi:hypothetical protein
VWSILNYYEIRKALTLPAISIKHSTIKTSPQKNLMRTYCEQFCMESYPFILSLKLKSFDDAVSGI